MNIAENVAKKRKERGMSQTELAEAVSVHRSLIGQIERGTKTLSLPLAAEMAVVLDCEIADFIDRPNTLRPPGMKN